MASSDAEVSLQQPLLDRLIDTDPSSRVEAPLTRAQAVRGLKEAVRRDLEWLLNTRSTPVHIPKAYSELPESVFNYGFPDLTSVALNSPDDESRLVALLEKTIARFEPRMAHVKVTPREPLRKSERMLHFQIDGLLMLDPAPEAISFDTVLNVEGSCEVKA